LVTCKSATAMTLAIAVPVLLVGTVSETPGGTLTLAVLVTVPTAEPATATWKVIVTRPLGGKVNVPEIPVTVALKVVVVAPPATWLITLLTVPKPTGRVSANVAAVAVLGPAFEITSAKESDPPAVTVEALTDFTSARSAPGVIVSVSVEVTTDAGAKVTPEGAEIVTTLVTAVCAMAPEDMSKRSTITALHRRKNASHNSAQTSAPRGATPTTWAVATRGCINIVYYTVIAIRRDTGIGANEFTTAPGARGVTMVFTLIVRLSGAIPITQSG
jgi:hypothetical protein